MEEVLCHFVFLYLHVLLGVDAAVGCQFVGLRQLSDSLLQAVHLRVHSIYGLRKNYGPYNCLTLS